MSVRRLGSVYGGPPRPFSPVAIKEQADRFNAISKTRLEIGTEMLEKYGWVAMGEQGARWRKTPEGIASQARLAALVPEDGVETAEMRIMEATIKLENAYAMHEFADTEQLPNPHHTTDDTKIDTPAN